MRRISHAIALTIALVVAGGARAADTDDVLTYQGELTLDGDPVEGRVDLEFRLHDTASGDTPTGPTLFADAVPVSGGLFIVDLDFGRGALAGGPRWLEITVDGATLSPRQPIIALPPATFLAPGAAKTPGPTPPRAESPGSPEPKTESVIPTTPQPYSHVAVPGEAAGRIPYPRPNEGRAPGGAASRGAGEPVPPTTEVNVEPRIERAGEGWQLNGSKIYYKAGNVGIGLTNPSYSLHIKSDKSRALFAQTSKKSATAIYGHSKAATGVGKGVWGSTSSATGYAGYFVGGRNYFSGMVGIGTNQPQEMLTVKGVVQSTEGGFRFPDGTVQTTAGGGEGFWSSEDDTNISNTNSGNVGIGTDAPGEKLTVGGTIESTTGGFKFPDGTVQDTAALGGGGDSFWGQSGDDISNTNSGNVGIGTDAPSRPLTVAGTIESTEGGFMFPDGSVQTTAVLEAGGDITSVTAGSGLEGGGPTGDVSVAIANDGVTSAHLDRDAASLLEVSGGVIQNVSNRIGVNVQIPETRFHVETNSSGDSAAIIGFHKSSQSGLVGILGQSVSDPGGIGVQAISKGVFGLNYGLWADAEGVGSYAGWFNTDTHINGKMTALVKQFRIDHPLDPANKYLSHSCVESQDMMNIYNGTVTTNAKGEAWVEMPEWFEALNRDFRYQLTVIGQFAQAIVADEIAGNRFRIRTDRGHVKVSWQVTGVRHDPVAEALRTPVVEEKPAAERGRYLAPEVYGDPAEAGIGYMPSALPSHGEARTGTERPRRVGGAR